MTINKSFQTVMEWFRSIGKRVKLTLLVLRKGLPKEEAETDKSVKDIISGVRMPGFPCPRCSSPIIVSISDLLASSSVSCAQCNLELKMDWQEDAKARQALENLQDVAREVEKRKKFTG